MSLLQVSWPPLWRQAACTGATAGTNEEARPVQGPGPPAAAPRPPHGWEAPERTRANPNTNQPPQDAGTSPPLPMEPSAQWKPLVTLLKILRSNNPSSVFSAAESS